MQTTYKNDKFIVSILDKNNVQLTAEKDITIHDVASTIVKECLMNNTNGYVNFNLKVGKKEYNFRIHEEHCFDVILFSIAHQIKL